MATSDSINIRPGVGILGLFPAMNYRAWYALGELVDNAIDSYLTHKKALRRVEGSNYKLRIVISVDGADGEIKVWDNAAGIATKDYGRAFVTAEPPTDSAGLSQFGIGLKSASCWFARQWRVTTTALGEDVRRTVDFDVPRIIRTGSDTLNVRVEKAAADAHGTEVRLWDLYKPPQTQTIGKMRRHLASMYRTFLLSGDVIIEFNGEPISYAEPDVLVAPYFAEPSGKDRRWTKPIEFTLKSGETVRGFVGIRQKGNTKEAGLALFRHGRLIMGSDDETYRPPEIFGSSNTFASQRVFGELHLDDFEVSHTKDAFIWGDREAEFLKALRSAMDKQPLPILKQADGYRARTASRDVKKVAQSAVASTAVALQRSAPVIAEQVVADVDDVLPSTRLPKSEQVAERTLDLNVRGVEWSVSIDLTTDPSMTDWLQIMDKPTSKKHRSVGIRVSLSHPFTQRFTGANAEQIEVMVRLAAGLAIAEITAREAGVREAGVIRRNLNVLLLDALSKE